MRRLIAATALLLASLAFIGAAPQLSPEDDVRQGNAAFEAGDYEAAVAAYTRAEERITDPGLVAFNKGAALYRLGQYGQAAAHYRRCLEDATGARRARMLYDLGNSLVQESQGRDQERLKQAVTAYAQCLQVPEAEEGTRTDARHNLELAKLLWLKAKLAAQKNPEGRDPKENPDPPDPTGKPPSDPSGPGEDPGTRPMGDPVTGPGERDPRGQQANPVTSQGATAPGSGNLPPIPDDKDHPRMAPEDATAHLLRAADRVLRERREHQQRMAPPPSRAVPDY